MSKSSPSPFPLIKVIQSIPAWLPQTMTWLYNQVRYLPVDIESHVVCEVKENLDQFSVPNIHLLPELFLLSRFDKSRLKGAELLSKIFRLWIMCRRITPDIVHSHFGTVGWVDSLVVRLIRAKHAVTFYGLDVNMVPTQDKKWINRYKSLFKSADLFLCEGPHMAKCLIKLGCPPNKVKIHHLGVEIEKIIYQPRQWQPGEILRVLIAATFREKKGIPYSLEALGELQKDVPVEITIIGEATHEQRSKEEKQRIINVMKRYNLQSKVNMLGFQPYSVFLEQAYKHHIFLSSSITAKDGDTEGGAPVSIIEMMASGMPIVSTKHCDIPNVIKHGETGLLAAERDVKELIAHLRWWVNHPDAWQGMLKAGRKKIENEFDVRVQAERLRGYYMKALHNS